MEKKYPQFCKQLKSYFNPHSYELILGVLEFADTILSGRKRYDGTPLILHSIHTASIVIKEIGLGRNSTVSTLLHDAVRLGLVSSTEAAERFGAECKGILDGLNHISDVNIIVGRNQEDNFRDLIISYSSDPRVILIKLADRLEVMRSLGMFPPNKRIQKSRESIQLYAQIAHKLGLYNIKSELEDISLSYIEPAGYQEIIAKLEDSAKERDVFIADFLKPVRKKLAESGIKYTIKSRTKTVYSIWTKMKRTGLPFEEIYDIFALRVIIDCPQEQEKMLCWNVYSVFTDFYTPNPDRLRDWISIPKSNGYESLHTTVVTDDGHWVEVQIRSERMDAVAERGIAAHWRYKGVNQGGMGSEQWLAKLRELMEHDPQMVAKQFGTDSTTGEIFVFTPKGDLRKLPEGSTLLDFAFDIHTDIGCTCIGGKVNHRNVPIKEVLHNGDIVEVQTSKTQKPKRDWLSIVKTGKAKNRIRTFLREEQAKAADLGREELERKLKNWKLNISIDDAVNVLCKHFKIKTGLELYSRIASEKIDIADTKEVLQRHLNGELTVETREKARTVTVKPTPEVFSDGLVIDERIRNLDYKFARCCNPIRGDSVFGFVTINDGITIHRTTCPNANRLREKYPYRIMSATWREEHTGGAFQATIRVTTDNITGILNRITDVISQELQVTIRSISMTPGGKNELSGIINIEVPGTNIVDMVIHRLTRIKGVKRAYRVTK